MWTLLAACLPCLVPATQSVLIVDAAGGGDFVDLQPAVDVAEEGAILLVEEGLYGGFELSGKSVQVRAREGARVRISSSVEIDEVLSSAPVILEGLDIAIEGTGATPLGVGRARGGVWLVDCSVEYRCSDRNPEQGLASAVTVLGLPAEGGYLALIRSDVRVEDCLGLTVFGSTALAVSALDADLYLYDSTVRGSTGGTAVGASVLASAAVRVVSSGSVLEGGDGYVGTDLCNAPANGGTALAFTASPFSPGSYELVQRGSSWKPGAAGSVCGVAGVDGVALEIAFGAAFSESELRGAAPTVDGPVQLQAGEAVDWVFSGAPDAAVGLLCSFQARLSDVPFLAEWSLVGGQPAAIPVGVLSGSGELAAAVPVPVLAAAGTVVNASCQVFSIDTRGALALGTPLPVLIFG